MISIEGKIFEIENKKISFSLIMLTADKPAMSFLTNTMTFSGTYGCNKCTSTVYHQHDSKTKKRNVFHTKMRVSAIKRRDPLISNILR